jgi:ORF6N domain
MFELTRDEIRGISQFVTSSDVKFSKRVTVFTEQGVAMLSSVLRSKRAVAVNLLP